MSILFFKTKFDLKSYSNSLFFCFCQAFRSYSRNPINFRRQVYNLIILNINFTCNANFRFLADQRTIYFAHFSIEASQITAHFVQNCLESRSLSGNFHRKRSCINNLEKKFLQGRNFLKVSVSRGECLERFLLVKSTLVPPLRILI